MLKHKEEDASLESQFSFLSGFWLGLDAISILFQGPSRYQPTRYADRGGVVEDWKVVARDGEKATRRIKRSAPYEW